MSMTKKGTTTSKTSTELRIHWYSPWKAASSAGLDNGDSVALEEFKGCWRKWRSPHPATLHAPLRVQFLHSSHRHRKESCVTFRNLRASIK